MGWISIPRWRPRTKKIGEGRIISLEPAAIRRRRRARPIDGDSTRLDSHVIIHCSRRHRVVRDASCAMCVSSSSTLGRRYASSSLFDAEMRAIPGPANAFTSHLARASVVESPSTVDDVARPFDARGGAHRGCDFERAATAAR